MKRVRFAITIIAGLYLCWLGMMVVHEIGHRVHARITAAIIDHVSIPLVGFSQTFYTYNPDPNFVAWGGPMWGSFVPLIILAGTYSLPTQIRRWAQFFAGFCLIANGAYLGIGWTTRTGDAGELMRHRTAVWELIAFGVVAISSGLYLWHRLGSDYRSSKQKNRGLPPAASTQSD